MTIVLVCQKHGNPDLLALRIVRDVLLSLARELIVKNILPFDS